MRKKKLKISVKTQLHHPWEQAGNVSITVLTFMYLHYLCISLNLTRPCCRLQRLNHINSFPESSYVYYCNTKIFGQVCKILLCFLFWARMTFTISIKMYQLRNCDLFLKVSASGSSAEELISDYKFFRLYHKLLTVITTSILMQFLILFHSCNREPGTSGQTMILITKEHLTLI